MIVTEENQELELFLRGAPDYLLDATASRIDREIWSKVMKMAKQFLVWDRQLF